MFLSLFLLPALALFAACGGDAAVVVVSDDDETATPRPTRVPTKEVSNSNAAAETLMAVDVPYDMANGYEIGSPDAKVVLTVYEDFQCPHCLNYTVNTEPMLLDEYVKAGKVRIEFQNLPILGQESVIAAAGGHCAAEQNLFWQYHSKVFLVQAEANQLTDEKLNVGRFTLEEISAFAEEIGADVEAFDACVIAEPTIAALTQQVTDAQVLGFRGTPSFAINGVAQSGQPSSAGGWRTLLDKAVEEAQ